MGTMRLVTASIIFFGFCLTLAMAKCGDKCKATQGRCSWTPIRDFDKMEKCSEGQPGKGTYCTCGDCYRHRRRCFDDDRNCERRNGKCQLDRPGRDWTSVGPCGGPSILGCRCWVNNKKCYPSRPCAGRGGTCQKNSPGRLWKRDGYCRGCPCWVKQISGCSATYKCVIRGGKCQKQSPGTGWMNADWLFSGKNWCQGGRGCLCWIPPCATEDPKCPSWGTCYRGDLSTNIHYIGPCTKPGCSCIQT